MNILALQFGSRLHSKECFFTQVFKKPERFWHLLWIQMHDVMTAMGSGSFVLKGMSKYRC